MSGATKAYFLGEWHLTRIIENVATGVIGEVWGEAVFSEVSGGLVCRENGVLRFGGIDWHTGRTSRWRIEEGRIHVDYEDGRPFHDFLMREPIALGIEDDTAYEISYDFHTAQWLSLWRMEGPGGRYEMSSRYRR